MDHFQLPLEPIEPKTETVTPVLSRPRSVTILALGVLIMTIINLSRLILSIRYWDFLASRPGISPLYVAITGFIWTLAGSLLLWGLWRAKIWAPRLMRALALTYAMYYWLDRVFLADHPVSGAVGVKRALLPVNWQFAASATIVCLAYIAWTLARRKVKVYFDQDAIKTNQNQATNDIAE